MWKFAHSPLNRQSYFRNDSARLKIWKMQENARLILINERYQILMQPDGVHPYNATHHPNAPIYNRWIYLGHAEEIPWFCARVKSGEFELSNHQQWLDLRLALPQLAEPYASILAYAKALIYWHQHHQFCGKCGSATFVHSGGHERFCEKCNQSIYPRTDPAIIVAITHKTQLFLARQKHWPAKRYSVLAGFVEPGESFEQAVEREVWEESQLSVHAIRYVGSQPWPFPCSIMVGFEAEAKSTQFNLQDDELDDALWVTPDSLVEKLTTGEIKLPGSGSISYHLIERWAHRCNISLTKYCD
jgi:NAD+ diphosphatase